MELFQSLKSHKTTNIFDLNWSGVYFM